MEQSEVSAPTPLQREGFLKGVYYGDFLRDELIKNKVFAPASMVGFIASDFLKVVAPMIMSNNPIVSDVQTVINKGTAFYLYEILDGLVRSDDKYFDNDEFKAGMKQLIQDFGGYDGSIPIKLIFDVPTVDFLSLIFNSDAHWTDYNRTKLAELTPALAPIYAPLEQVAVELFPPYRQYVLYRDDASEHSKRVASSILRANASFYNSWLPFLERYRSEYRTEGFVSRMQRIIDLLSTEANTAMKGIGS